MYPAPDPWSRPVRVAPDPALRVETARGADAFDALEPAWRALDAAGGPCPADLGLCRQAARDLSPEGVRLVQAWEGARLVAIWPLHQGRLGPLRVVQRLARGLQAHDGPTGAPDVDAARVCRALWAEVRGWRDADVLQLSSLDAAHPLLALPEVARTSHDVARTCTVDLRGLDRVEQVVAAQSKSRRSNLRRRRRKLEAAGAVRFEALVPPARRRAAMARLLDQKEAWLDDREAVSPTFRAPWFRRGLEAAAADPDARHLCVFQLTVGDRPAAWEVGHRDGGVYRSFLAGYDPALADLGPGVALQTEVMAWCARQGLHTYDLLAPVTPFKEEWATGRSAVRTSVVPLRRRGEVLVPLIRDGRQALKELLAGLPPAAQALALQVARARQAWSAR